MLRLRHPFLPANAASLRSAVVTAAIFALAASDSPASHAQTIAPPTGAGNIPIAVTGWNQNIINSASNTTSAAPFDYPNRYGYFANGYLGNYTGLPSDGTAAMDGNTYQFQSYTGNNALYLTANPTYQSALGVATTGTLTLNAPTAYTTLSFLATSANGGGTSGAVTLNFADGSTGSYTYSAPDWYNSGTGQFAKSALLNRDSTNGAINTNSGGNFGITESRVTLSAADAAKTIKSLTFTAPVTDSTKATTTAIFAVSGRNLASYTPNTVNSLSIASGAFTANSGFAINGLNQTTTSTSAYIKQTSATNSVLRLTDGTANEASSAFTSSKVNVAGAFTTSSSFMKTGGADGLTFTLQGNTPYGVGAGGGGLGYTGTTFTNSIGIALNDYNGSGVALVQNGAIVGSYVAPAASFSNNTLVTANLAYDGTNNLLVTLTNSAGTQIFNTNYTVGSIASIVGGNSAFLGFTGGSGTITETQDIYAVSYSLGSAATPEPGSLALLPLGLAGIAGVARRRKAS